MRRTASAPRGVVWGSACGLALARWRYPEARQRASFAVSAALSNVGHTLGGFLCFLLLGEHAFSQSVVYTLYFLFFTYLICFPVAHACSAARAGSRWQTIRQAVCDLRSMPMLGIAAGTVLLLSGIPRPQALGQLQAFLLPASTASTMFGLGLTFQARRLPQYWPDAMLMSALKFLVTPVLAWLGIQLFGLEGETASVVMILSTMPTAIYACIIATIYDLEIDMTNAFFIFTTLAFLVFVLPVLVLRF